MAGPIQYLPCLRPGLRLVPAAQAGEHSVVRADGKAVRMPNRFVALLLLCDGTRAAREIAERASVGGGEVAAELVVKLAEQMAAHEVVDLVPRVREVETWGEPRHACQTCGASCEHHLIGPLPAERVAQITRDHARLAEHVPRLRHQPPLMPMPDGEGEALAVIDGRCVFLGDDRLCLLHGHFGAQAKPLTCQTFPIASVEAEGEIRVGVQPSCYTLHRTFREGPRVTAEALSEGDLGYRTPASSVALPALGRSIAATPMEEEATLLGWLAEPDLTLAELFARVAGAPPARPPRVALPLDKAEALHRLLVGVARGRVAEMAAHRAPTVHHGHTWAMFSALAALEAVAPDLTLPPPHRAFVMFAIGQGVFVRETGRLPAPRLGALVLALGALVAVQVAPPGQEEEISDGFAQAMIAWNRRFVVGVAFAELFAGPEAIEALLGGWR